MPSLWTKAHTHSHNNVTNKVHRLAIQKCWMAT